jgi:hypothetical protein
MFVKNYLVSQLGIAGITKKNPIDDNYEMLYSGSLTLFAPKIIQGIRKALEHQG